MKPHACLISAAVAVAAAAFCGAASATEYGTVVSSKPIAVQVPIPQRQCSDQPVTVQPPTGGGGAMLGAIAGGVIGHAIGGGAGRAAATGLGIIAGSVVGDRIEADNTPPATVPVRSCQTVTTYQNRVIGYDVVYDYNGQRYQATLAQAPGERIALNIAPAAASVAPVPGPVASVAVAPAPEAAAPVVVYAPPPVAYAVPSPYDSPYYGLYYSPYAYYGPAVVIGGRVGFGGRGHRWR